MKRDLHPAPSRPSYRRWIQPVLLAGHSVPIVPLALVLAFGIFPLRPGARKDA